MDQAGVNGLLDVARTSYKEANADAFELATQLGGSVLRESPPHFSLISFEQKPIN